MHVVPMAGLTFMRTVPCSWVITRRWLTEWRGDKNNNVKKGNIFPHSLLMKKHRWRPFPRQLVSSTLHRASSTHLGFTRNHTSVHLLSLVPLSNCPPRHRFPLFSLAFLSSSPFLFPNMTEITISNYPVQRDTDGVMAVSFSAPRRCRENDVYDKSCLRTWRPCNHVCSPLLLLKLTDVIVNLYVP